MMAVVENIAERAKTRKAAITAKLPSLEAGSPELASAQKEMHRCDAVIQTEAAKRQKWKAENIRRRHNYFPFIVQALRELAAAKQLSGVEAAARKRGADKYREQQEKQKKQKS